MFKYWHTSGPVAQPLANRYDKLLLSRASKILGLQLINLYLSGSAHVKIGVPSGRQSINHGSVWNNGKNTVCIFDNQSRCWFVERERSQLSCHRRWSIVGIYFSFLHQSALVIFYSWTIFAPFGRLSNLYRSPRESESFVSLVELLLIVSYCKSIFQREDRSNK